MLIAKTIANTSATHASPARSPTNTTIREITTAAAHGQRWIRHSSQGVSPPQYCDSSAVPSTAALTTNTKPAKTRVVRLIP